MSLLPVTFAATAAASTALAAAWRAQRARRRAEAELLRLREAHRRERRHGAFLAAVLDRIPHRVVVADLEDGVLLANDAMRAAHPGARLQGDGSVADLGLYELDGETLLEPGALPLQRALAGERVQGREIVCRPPGTPDQRRLVFDAAPLHDDAGRVIGAVATASDITDVREAELRLAEANLVLRAVRDATHDLHADPDVPQAICQATRFAAGAAFALFFAPDGEGALVTTGAVGYDGELPMRLPLGAPEPAAVVQAFRTGLSLLAADAEDDPYLRAAWARDHRLASAMIEPVLDGEQPLGVLVVGWRQPVTGADQPAAMAVQLLADEAAAALERAELVERLRRLSLRDPLTGLPNRRAWDDELAREMSRSQRYDHPLCVALLDLDRFKAYNDRLGHQAGDWLLRAVSGSWTGVLRDTDVVARWGGEEFVVCLPNCSAAEAECVLSRLRSVVPDSQTCSIGLAEWDGEESAEALLQRADRALYAAKEAGRDRLVTAG